MAKEDVRSRCPGVEGVASRDRGGGKEGSVESFLTMLLEQRRLQDLNQALECEGLECVEREGLVHFPWLA